LGIELGAFFDHDCGLSRVSGAIEVLACSVALLFPQGCQRSGGAQAASDAP
jgi:hypothetical protein